MRIEIPQIFWHGNRDRIMSIDFYPNTNYLVTSGAESENKMYVKLWRIEEIIIDNSNTNISQSLSNPKFKITLKIKKIKKMFQIKIIQIITFKH